MVKEIPFGNTTLYAIDGEFLLDGKEYYCKGGYLFTTRDKCKNNELVRKAIEHYGTETLFEIEAKFAFKDNGELECCFSKIKTLWSIVDDYSYEDFSDITPKHIRFPACVGNFTNLRIIKLKGEIVDFIHDNFKKLPNLYEVDLVLETDVIPSGLTEADISNTLYIRALHATSLQTEFKCYRLRDLLLIADMPQVPASIGNLINLEDLFIKNNVATTLPHSIQNCRKLRNLRISMDKLEQLPYQIENLENLSLLHIESKELAQFPSSICSLRNLKDLDFSFCENLRYFPTCLGNMTTIEQLSIQICRNFTSLPENIGNMQSLIVLYIVGANVERLPDSVGNLSNLEYLGLWDANLKSLPDTLDGLNSIQNITLLQNPISTLPESFFSLRTLRKLDIRGTNMTPEYVNYIRKRMPWVEILY